jgi:hypothetical protein
MAVKRYYRRRFLNLRGHHAGAYVIADCGIADHDDNRIDAMLTIADCHRVTELDFDFVIGHGASARNALHKARVLREVVDGFVAALEAVREETHPARRG